MARLAKLRPFDHMILLLTFLSSPKESRLVLGNLLMQSFMKKVKDHDKHGETRQG